MWEEWWRFRPERGFSSDVPPEDFRRWLWCEEWFRCLEEGRWRGTGAAEYDFLRNGSPLERRALRTSSVMVSRLGLQQQRAHRERRAGIILRGAVSVRECFGTR